MSRKANTDLSDKLPSTVKELAEKNQITYEEQLKQLGGSEGLLAVTPTVQEGAKGKFAQLLFGNPGKEQELVDGKLMSKMRQKGLGRFTSGLSDALTLNLTDFDQRGGGFLGLKDVNPLSGLGGKPEDYILPNTVKEIMEKRKESKNEKESTDPLDQIDRIYKNQQEYERAMGGFNRKGRVLDNALDFINMRMQMPSVIKDLKDVSTFKQQQLLDAEAIKQGLADAVQARTLSAAKEASELSQATAAQQDAATRFAGLGMQRRFG